VLLLLLLLLLLFKPSVLSSRRYEILIKQSTTATAITFLSWQKWLEGDCILHFPSGELQKAVYYYKSRELKWHCHIKDVIGPTGHFTKIKEKNTRE